MDGFDKKFNPNTKLYLYQISESEKFWLIIDSHKSEDLIKSVSLIVSENENTIITNYVSFPLNSDEMALKSSFVTGVGKIQLIGMKKYEQLKKDGYYGERNKYNNAHYPNDKLKPKKINDAKFSLKEIELIKEGINSILDADKYCVTDDLLKHFKILESFN
eukprot:Anaeramoba_ignava/a4648_6.p1 GENE.a4648_6~~a4648_6.p1  ORF type:complete len:161 (-),score=23.26 a4648_6:7-489(-)